MAGYIFSLDNLDSLHLYTRNGVYSTKMRPPSGYWAVHHEGTFADYVSMKPGDNVYFFIERKIYGIGKLLAIGGDCKYFNYPGAGDPQTLDYQEIRNELLWDEGEMSVDQRCVCFSSLIPISSSPGSIWMMSCHPIHPPLRCSGLFGSYRL